MAHQTELERFHTFLNVAAIKLSKQKNKLYLEGLSEALTFLLDDILPEGTDELIAAQLHQEKTQIIGEEFDEEHVRKAIQLALLKGFKSASITNAQITPDTIGMFIAYLVEKLYAKCAVQNVLDPLIGTGNLVATLHNHLRHSFNVIGVDDDPIMCNLARNMCDALQIENQVFMQNTLTYQTQAQDLILFDLPPLPADNKGGYFPYVVILHHLTHLKPQHYMIALIENNFFDQDKSKLFKEELSKHAHLFGLIKLDESLFTTHPKSILILKKKADSEEKTEDFLLVDLPSFTDKEAFHKAIVKMDIWFKEKEVDAQ